MTLAACQQEVAPLGTEISVNPVSLSVEGQNAATQTVEVTANGDWITVSPQWITVTPAYGTGNTTVTLTFADNLDADNTLAAARTAKVYFSVTGAQAALEVVQAGDPNKAPAEIQTITCAEFNALEDNAGPYRLTGTIVNVEEVSASYKNANLTIADETGEVYLYRVGPGVDENGDDRKIENFGLAVGDILTVEGTKGSYNNNPQMAQGGSIITHIKSLLTVDSTPLSFEKEAGSFTLKVAVSNDPDVDASTLFNAPEVDVDWLVFDGWTVDGKKILAQFSYEEYNEKAAPREAKISFSAGNGNMTFTTIVPVIQNGDIPDPVAIETAVANEKGTWVSVQGIVMGMNKRGYILMDEAGKSIYAHVNAVPEVELGDEVKLAGNLDANNCFWQIAKPVSIVLSKGNKVTYPEPVVVDAAEDIDPTAEGTHLPFYIEATGVPTGNYGDMTIVEGYKVSPYQTSASINVADYIGKTVKYHGYAYQNYKGATMNIMLLSVEEVAAQ